MIKAKLVLPDVAAVPSKEQSDWSVNNPESAGYVKNRTHYKEDVVSYIPVAESVTLEFTERDGSYKATLSNASLTLGTYKITIQGHEGLYDSVNAGDTYYINITEPSGISVSYKEGETFVTFVDSNATTSYSTSLSMYLQKIAPEYHKLSIDYIPSDEIANEIFPTMEVDASVSSDVNDIVTLKRGIRNHDGRIENTDESDITLAKVAKTGSYNDLGDIPTDIATQSFVEDSISTHNTANDSHSDIRNVVSDVASGVSSIESLIPNGATSTNKLVSDSGVDSKISSEIGSLDSTATIATVSNDIVTIKGGLAEEDGIVSNDSSEDITLAKVSKTGSYNDLIDKPTGMATETYVNNQISSHNESASAHSDIRNEISDINSLIPNQASSSNQLADKDFVNSSIATSTATFKGSYNVVSDMGLHYNSSHSDVKTWMDANVVNCDNNDYSEVLYPTSDSAATEIFLVERWKYNTAWEYDYPLNNSGFTSAQWKSINSGATSELIAQITTNKNAIDAMDSTATIASVSNDVVTLKGGLVETNGVVTNDSSNDIELSKVAKTGNYGDLSNTPTNTSDFTNDGSDGTSAYVEWDELIQPDWEQEDSYQLDYIKNKPSIKAGTGTNSIIEGSIDNNTANGFYSHAEGDFTSANMANSHAEGYSTTANGNNSHAEGNTTIASGASQHVFGEYNIEDDLPLWISGTSYNVGDKVKHDSDTYQCIQANSDITFTSEKWKDLNGRLNYVEIVGNGNENTSSNARTLDWDGNETLMGSLTVGGTITADGASILPQVQADWDENSPTESSYVRNRTHYIDEVGTIFSGTIITLTVDGGYARGAMYGYGTYPIGFWDLAVVGNFLRLTVGSMVFEGELKPNLSSGIYIGNGYLHNSALPDTGEGWCYYCDSAGFDSFHLMCDESLAGTYETTVFPNEHIYVPLDERFVPDSITRNSDLVNASVAYAHDITPELSDAIEDDTTFIWQTSGGSANIPPKSTAIVQSILGNSPSVSTSCSITQLKSRIYNLFDYKHDTVSEYHKLDYEASLVSDSSYNVYWVPILAGVDGGNNGYVMTATDGVTLADTGFGVVGVAYSAGDEPSYRISASSHGNSNSFLPSADCWLVFHVLRGYEDKLCLHFAWSGYNDGVFGEYEEDVLSIPNAESLRGIGSVCDEIVPGKHIQRIGVGNTKDYTWERWTEDVYNPSTGDTEAVFMGWKTSSISDIALTTNTVMQEQSGDFSSFYSDGGVLFAPCSLESSLNENMLTNVGISILYALETPIETSIQYNGYVTVGDFGDMQFDTSVIPSEVLIKYGANYRDTIRSISNSGVTFSGKGIVTSGVYFSPDVAVITVAGTYTVSSLSKMTVYNLTSVDNTIVLPTNLGTNAFSIQCKIVQDATGSRNLYFVMDDGNGGTTNIKNPSEVDFSVGSANQSCIATLLYDGNGSWWIEATNYVD